MSKLQQDRLSYAVLRHLHDLIEKKVVTGEAAESMAVANQCLVEALGVDINDPAQSAKLKVDKSLQVLFDEAFPAPPPPKTVTKDEESRANMLKDEGNELMKQNKYEEAVEKYSEAIEVYPYATYYCNRAAGYSKLNRHDLAVNDAKEALKLDPEYSKAYARMGFAYLSLNKLKEAEDSYVSALRLDPDNKSYTDNLDAVKEKINAGPLNPQNAPGGLPLPNLGGMDFSQIINNPAFMNMAQQFMQDPNMQRTFQQMADQFLSAGGMPGMPGMSGGAGGGLPENMDLNAMMNDPAIRQLGESFASQNPDIADELRRQFRPPGSEDPENP